MTENLGHTALIVEPNIGQQDKYKRLIESVKRFDHSETFSSIEDARKSIQNTTHFSHVFLSGDLADGHMTEFISSSKASENPSKFILVVMPTIATKRKVIEKAIVLGVDAILFGPHNFQTINDALNSLEETSLPFGNCAPMSLLISEIMGELDGLAEQKSRETACLNEFRERLQVLRQITGGELETYYTAALELFIHHSQPKTKNRAITYSGASKRVRQIVEQHNSKEAE